MRVKAAGHPGEKRADDEGDDLVARGLMPIASAAISSSCTAMKPRP